MESLTDYLDALEDIIETSRAFPFSSKISIDKESVTEIISEMRLNMPNEIRQAQRIISDHDKILKDAEAQAISMIKDAEHQCEKMANEHEIYKKAIEQANELLDEAKQSARDVRLNAMSYADEILSKTETIIKESMVLFNKETRKVEDHFASIIEILYSNRKELNG